MNTDQHLAVSVEEIRGDVKTILAIMGEREKAQVTRDATADDHEARLRSLEATFSWREGARAAVAAVAGFIASFVPL